MFKDVLKKERKKANLTQKQLADLLNTTPQNISQYERGKRFPRIDKVLDIADALGIDPKRLMSDSYSFSDIKNDMLLARYLESMRTPETDRTNKLLFSFSLLNETGQNKVIDYSEDLEKNNDYLKDKYKKE